MHYFIHGYHGGLGDQLQFSTLPERLSEQGHHVYTLRDASYRNPDIKPVVWGRNLYVKGDGPGPWNLGDIPGVKYEQKTGSFIGNWELAFGLEPANDLPKLYGLPFKSWRDGVIIPNLLELSSVTLKYQPHLVGITVQQLMAKHGHPQLSEDGCFVQMESDTQSGFLRMDGVARLAVRSLEAAGDLIYRASVLITLNSGLHALAAAIRRERPDLVHYCILPKADAGWIYEGRRFIFPGVHYIVEGEHECAFFL